MNIKKAIIVVAVVLSPLLMANQGCEPKNLSSSAKEQISQERNQSKLLTVQPPPQISVSAERKNLIERLKRLNTENITGCIYLISHGSVMAFYPVKGKVTSLNSYLTGKEKPTYFGGMRDKEGNYLGGMGWQMAESPDYDGAYGENAHGVFFFTADTNSYVEWVGEYLWSDSCLTISVRPTLVRTVK